MKRIGLLAIMLSLMLVLGGCVPGDGTYTTDPAGFFWGIWHGWIAPVSLILGLFNDTYRVYEVNNTGWFYDLGFYIAIISGFGGIAVTRKNRG